MSYIDDQRRIVFIHVPKTAGTSMEHTGILGGQGHITITEYFLTTPGIATYFKFGFVRNPWDRLVSTYFFFRNMPEDYWMFHANDPIIRAVRSYSSFSEFTKKLLQTCIWPHARVFWPQSTLLCLPSGEIGVDFVGRYEHLERDWTKVCKKLGAEERVPLPRKNTSGHEHYSSYYGADERECVARAYASDITLFGYDWLD
jgi:hypothetical protein